MECIICLQDEKEEDLKVFESPNCTCHVILHQSCLDRWLDSRGDSDEKERCPICRTEGKSRRVRSPDTEIDNEDAGRICLSRCFVGGFILSFSVGLIVVVRLAL